MIEGLINNENEEGQICTKNSMDTITSYYSFAGLLLSRGQPQITAKCKTNLMDIYLPGFFYVNAWINPIIYAWTDKNFKRAFTKLFGYNFSKSAINTFNS